MPTPPSNEDCGLGDHEFDHQEDDAPHHVVGIRGADRFRNHVLHAERLENRAHRTTPDDAGTRRRGAQKHFAGTVAALYVVMKRTPFR